MAHNDERRAGQRIKLTHKLYEYLRFLIQHVQHVSLYIHG